MRRALIVGLITLASVAGAQDWQAAFDFEAPGAWLSAPELLDLFPEEQLWLSRHTTFAEMADGVTLSREHVFSGETSARWADHPRFPTIHTRAVPPDWSGFAGISLQAWSEDATGERITVGVLSDSAETPHSDWFVADLVVDWTGWREISLPFGQFRPLGEPAGWESVQGLYLFTKAFDRQPNPNTVLYLDAVELLDEPPAVSWAAPEPAENYPIPVRPDVPVFDASVMNHRWPELREPAVAPILNQPYFNNERAMFGYYPRFQPGTVSVSPDGQAWIRYGGQILQTLGEDGAWQWRSILEDTLIPYAQTELGFRELTVSAMGSGDDASIRWDADGDAYMLCFVSDPTGDWKARTGLLLHSRDGLQTWDVYRLPWYMARMEKNLGQNPDRLDRPPVLLMARYFAPTEIYLTIPRKLADGTLEIPEATLICDDAMPMSAHSGEAGMAVTVGDTVYMVYGRLTVLEGRTKEDGAPAYAITYHIPSGRLSKPVLIGFGGINAEDNHNWPGIAVDPEGYLHVIINGHHNPFRYTRSVRPLDISEWTEPEEVAAGTSYAGLICDSEGTLYSVTRHSDPGYYFRLSLHRKRAGQPWEEPQPLVVPHNPYYRVYYHKLTIDPVTEKLFLSYWSQSASICLFRDEFEAYAYIWPDREVQFLSKEGAVRPIGALNTEERKYEFYAPKPSEPTILVSDDRGDTWDLATTGDFLQTE